MTIALQDVASETLSLSFHTPSGRVEEAAIDAWELKASRRALNDLKTLLYGERMLDLLREQIEAADEYYRGLIAASGGDHRECRVDVSVQGLSAAAFLGWFAASLEMEPRQASITRIFPAHPEHYASVQSTSSDPSAPARHGIVEVIGERVGRLFLTPVPEADLPPAIARLADSSYPYKMPMSIALLDGTPFGFVLHEMREKEDGADIILRALFPAASPDELVAGHIEHFSIEFRNWLHAAARELSADE